MRRLFVVGALSLVVLVAGGAAADTFAVTLVSQTNSTITLGWTPQPGYGYLFSLNGQLVSRTNDPSRSTVKFSKGTSYDIDVIVKGANGHYPVAPPPPKNQCEDTVDNDGDGKIDLADPGCSSASDNDETDPAPPAGNVVEISGTISSSSFLSRIAAAPAGALTVRPVAGQQSFTVTGDFTLSRQNVTIQHAVMRDVTIREAGSGFVIEDSDLHSFDIDGADNWIIRRDNVHFDGVSYTTAGSQFMYGARNWKILDSTFSGFYSRANPSWHTEAWFIGDGNDGGLIQGNRFDDNGTTGHIFFTWWGQSGSGPGDPKNICVTGNTFTRSHNAYWHIDMRAELNANTNNIDIDPNTNVWDKPYSYTVLAPRFVRPC